MRTVVACAGVLVSVAGVCQAQQVMWKDNPITGKVVGLTYIGSPWLASESEAVGYGGHLLTIRSAAENNWAYNEFGSFFASSGSSVVWIGLSDHVVEGQWAWSSGEPVGYTNWVTDPPLQNASYDFVFMASLYGARWSEYGQTSSAGRGLIEVPHRPARSWSWPMAQAAISQRSVTELVTLDWDGDSDQDLVACAYSSPGATGVIPFRNDLSASLTALSELGLPSPAFGGIQSAVAFDLGNDGKEDLAISQGGRVIVYPSINGSLGTPFILHAAGGDGAVGTCDINNDGLDDLLYVSSHSSGNPGSIRTFVQTPQGSLISGSTMPSTQANIVRVRCADVDNDGDQDLITAGVGHDLCFYPGSSGGGFVSTPAVLINSGMGCNEVELCDVDHDGRLEIVALEASQSITVFRLTGGAYSPVQSFTQASTQGSFSIAISDVDLDGNPDLLLGRASSQTLYHGNGVGFASSSPVNLYAEGPTYYGILEACDVNGDFQDDIIACTDYNDAINGVWWIKPQVILNEGRQDCNANGIEDLADIASGTEQDCNGNSVPDTCDLIANYPDCDFNGLLDSCQIAQGASDCNLNDVPDSCDISVGFSSDLNQDGIPDECAVDCNANGIGDSIEIAFGLTSDCNANQVPDDCDISAGAPDCNNNGKPDSCDIAAGTIDCDGDGLLDVCETDANNDSIPDDCQDGGTPYCFGTGTGGWTPCPCGNVGQSGNGCPNSVNAAGANLTAVGLPSRVADTLLFQASGMPGSVTVLFLQGTGSSNGLVFGDGLRCTSGGTIRLGYTTTSGTGTAQLPQSGGTAVHVLGQIAATGAVTRYYQTYFRDPDPSFCTTNKFNWSNGVSVIWVP